ncbi:uncharacterized protein N7477_002994 [Penicillium maclennaniae]|uniref:uncharacterized protein n=1 Tax=Penicillium maclennaniae TaxID=1343394 RepID=UPI00253F777E|nr:uncharacterized protein N7477_002994 [Penicillium maclennaniae]KAJ5677361.1 hypothetical protein N7477_002994 [Penicillium maclennaniae]
MNLIKGFHIILYLYLEQLFTGLCFAQNNATGTAGLGGACKGNEITTRQVSHCQCQLTVGTQCKNCDLSQDCPNSGSIYSHSQLEKCGVGCTDDNNACNSCYIWFEQLCKCLQDGAAVCPQSPSTSAGAYWVLMSSGSLMTTTQLIPGIRELSIEDPWEWGQQLYTRGSQALAINSARTRSQEQIHMHICSINQAAQTYLDNLDHTNYQSLTKIPGKPWYCRANQNKGQPISGVTADTQNRLASGQVCVDYVGAAVIVDSRDRTWACVTYDDSTTEYVFCH